jgi:sulfur carrier protein
MQIVVNGQEYQTEARTAAALLRELQTPEIGVAMALNGEVVRKSQLQQTTISEGSNIEIVRAVQGG